MSSRWSYGPEGLRERPATTRWSDAELLPSWRDLQPLLIRSAGVVGIVATVLAVVSSDALRFGSEAPAERRNERPADLSAAEAPIAPVIAAVSDLQAEGSAVAPAPIEPAPPELVKAVAVENPDPPAPSIEPPAPSHEPAVADLRTGTMPAPAVDASAPFTTSSVPAPTAPVASEANPVLAVSAFASTAPSGDASPATALATPAEMSLTTLGAFDAPPNDANEADDAPSPWPEDAANCPRDWVAPDATESSSGSAMDCAATTELIASVETDPGALEEAAAQHAEILATLPRVPLARPEPPAGFKPSNPHATLRVNSRNSSWPPGPPPNCGAGKRAKWHYVNRNSGAKEWYCR